MTKHAKLTEPPQKPTPQRMKLGRVEQGWAKDPADPRGKHEAKVWIDHEPVPLARMRYRETITYRQFQAGLRLEALVMRLRASLGTGGRRDSLDMTPRGGSQPEHVARVIDDTRTFTAIARAAGKLAMDAAIKVCADHQALKDAHGRPYQRTCAALDAAANYWGMAE